MSDYAKRLERVLAKAEFGDPVKVHRDDTGAWVTRFGPVVRATTVGEAGLGVGPVVLFRRDPDRRPLRIYGTPPGVEHVSTELRFDDNNRLYLAATADNGMWVWQLHRAAEGCSLARGNPMFVGVWRD